MPRTEQDLNCHLDRLEDAYHTRVLEARAKLHAAGFSWTEVQDLASEDLFELAAECEG